MTSEDLKKMSSAERMRLVVRNMDRCREDFLDRFTERQIMRIFLLHLLSAFDFYPDQWEERQIQEALGPGLVPCWSEKTEKPVYPPGRMSSFVRGRIA